MPKRRRESVDADDRRSSSSYNPPVINATALDETGLTRSEEFWFEDGNVVIHAESTLFLVHRGVLARNSPVFADVFRMARPDGEPTVDGCPVVKLFGDSAGDVGCVLGILYDRRYDVRGPIPMSAAVAMVRMGRKYDMKPLEDDAMRRIRIECPTTLAAYYRTRGTWTEFDNETRPVALANHMYQLNIKEALPSLYFYLASESVYFLVRGIEHANDESEKQLLIPEIQRAVLCGQDELRDWFEDAFSWTEDLLETDECICPVVCSRVFREYDKALWKPRPDLDMLLEPWAEMLNPDEQKADRYGKGLKDLCSSCHDSAKAALETHQQDLWEDLPRIFGLSESWEQLKAS